MNNGNIFQQLIAATFTVGAYEMHWLEFIGILIGAASAYLGMKRWVWAWPVGIIGNVILFTVFFGVAVMTTEGRHPLYGQAFRQVFFIITSVYGWWLWNRARQGKAHDAPAIVPRWATDANFFPIIARTKALPQLLGDVREAVASAWPRG